MSLEKKPFDFNYKVRKCNFDNLLNGSLDYILVNDKPKNIAKLILLDKYYKFDRIVIQNTYKKRLSSSIVFEHKSTQIVNINYKRYIRINLGLELERG